MKTIHCPKCRAEMILETPPAIYDEPEAPRHWCPACAHEESAYVLAYHHIDSGERILARSFRDLELCFHPDMPTEWEDAKRALIDDEKSRFERTDFSTPEDNYILARDPDLSDEEWEGAEWVSEPSEPCNFGGTAR